MKKVFHLLRDNIQSGPFTIDELLQHKLSSTDLIWVEGYSHAWCLPTELDLLTLSSTKTATALDVNPSAPDVNTLNKGSIQSEIWAPTKNKKKRKWADEDIEGRAEEIRRRTLEYVSSKNTTTAPLITDEEIRSFVKTPDIDFIVHKKSRGISANFIGASLVVLMLVVGWYEKDKFFMAQHNSDILSTQAATPQVIPISSTVQMPPSQNESAAFIDEDEDSMMIGELKMEQISLTTNNRSAEQQSVVVASSPDNKIAEAIKVEKQPVKEAEDFILIQPEKKEAAVFSKNDSAKSDSAKTKDEINATEETEESIEKKKTLGQAIKGIFKKKKKDKDTVEEYDD